MGQKKNATDETPLQLPKKQPPQAAPDPVAAAETRPKQRQRQRPVSQQLEREELLSIRLMPVLRERVCFGPTQSGLGLNGGFISVAPKNLLGVIRSVAAGAAPLSTDVSDSHTVDHIRSDGSAEIDRSPPPTARRGATKRQLGVPFDVWLPASPWPMRLATCVLTLRFIIGIQLRSWMRDSASGSTIEVSPMARVVLEFMGTYSGEYRRHKFINLPQFFGFIHDTYLPWSR